MSENKYGEPWVYVYVEVVDFSGPTCAIQDPSLTYHEEEPKEWSYRQLVDANDNDIEIDQQDNLTGHGKRAVLCVNLCAGYTEAQIAEALRLLDNSELHDRRRKELFEAAISIRPNRDGETVILDRDLWGKLQEAIAMVTIGWDNPDCTAALALLAEKRGDA